MTTTCTAPNFLYTLNTGTYRTAHIYLGPPPKKKTINLLNKTTPLTHVHVNTVLLRNIILKNRRGELHNKLTQPVLHLFKHLRPPPSKTIFNICTCYNIKNTPDNTEEDDSTIHIANYHDLCCI